MRYREARVHAVLLASILWIAAAILTFGTSGRRNLVGTLKGADFAHFYTLGFIARTGQTAALYDLDAQHQLQTSLVPESEGDVYLPVYPPQMALVFAPFSLWSYGAAALLWAIVTIAIYTWSVRTSWRPVRHILSDRVFLIAAAAGFPPFWNLVLHGQTTPIPLVAFCLGWLALERRWPYLAGLAFGLLAMKPQFGLMLAAVTLLCGEWSMLAGAVTSVAMQSGIVMATLGSSALHAFVAASSTALQSSAILESKPYQFHSLRAVTSLLPSWSGTALWMVLSLGIVIQTVRVWRANVPIRVRLGVVVLASVLVNPHVAIYDATVLALPLIWIGGEIIAYKLPVDRYWSIVYWLFVTLLLPTAALVRVQLSVLILVWLFLEVTRTTLAQEPDRIVADARA